MLILPEWRKFVRKCFGMFRKGIVYCRRREVRNRKNQWEWHISTGQRANTIKMIILTLLRATIQLCAVDSNALIRSKSIPPGWGHGHVLSVA